MFHKFSVDRKISSQFGIVVTSNLWKDFGPIADFCNWWNKFLLLCKWNKPLNKHTTKCLVNYVIVLTVSFKSKIFAFDKFY